MTFEFAAKRGPGKREIKPTNAVLMNIDLPPDEDDDDDDEYALNGSCSLCF